MMAVVQRVTQGSVTVDRQTVGAIDHGLLVLIGVARGDSEMQADYLAEKIAQMRIFEDGSGKMNRSLLDTGGSMLVVSQFTLLGDCRKGRRPSFAGAAPPDQAETLYSHFIRKVAQMGVPTAAGRFGASMQVSLTNDGPVTLVIEA